MAGTRNSKTGHSKVIEHDDTAGVTAFLETLEHPLKEVIQQVRAAILAAGPQVTEGVKWNAPSFYFQGWFATMNLRGPGVLIVLHHGAKAPKENALPETLDDPSGLLTWLARDRATIRFAGARDFTDKQAAFQQIIQQWLQHQAHLASVA